LVKIDAEGERQTTDVTKIERFCRKFCRPARVA
jgi:hypothetical protein